MRRKGIMEYWNTGMLERTSFHRFINSLLYFFSMLLIFSCCKRNIAPVKKNVSSSDDPKLIEATIIDYSKVDGCGFLIELTNKEKLQPENLSSEFEKDKLRVLIRYHITNRISVCMAGKTVYIDHIKIKKE